MDFIIELLESIKLNTVITVVNSVFKITHFIPTYTTVSIEEIARIFLYMLC